MRRVAEQAAGRALSDAAVSSHFVRQCVRVVATRARDATRLFAYKLWLTTHAWELPINVSYAWFREQVLLLTLLPVGAWLLVPLGLAAVVGGHLAVPALHQGGMALVPLVAADLPRERGRLLRRRSLPSAGAGARRDLRGDSRVDAAIARRRPTPQAQRRLRRHRRRVALALAGGLVPLPFHLGEADADTRMALHAIDAGRDDEGRAWLGRAVARHPAPGVPWFRAGLAWQARNELADAERALREAHRLDPGGRRRRLRAR